MNISIKNIGVIENSSIDVNMLTVITGQNNSGKTTIGKILYSVFSAKENLYENATSDIINFSKNQVIRLLRESSLSIIFRSTKNNWNDKDTVINYELNELFNAYKGNFPDINSIEEMQNYIASLVHLLQIHSFNKTIDSFVPSHSVNSDVNIHEKLVNDSIILLNSFQELIITINRLSDFSSYEKTKILKTLLNEFNKQISPVRYPEKYISEITLKEANDLFIFNINNKLKQISTEGYLGFNNISNVLFIDDATVIDNANPNLKARFFQRQPSLHIDDFSNAVITLNHKISLMLKLSETNDIVNTIVDNDKYQRIIEKINQVLNDQIIVRDGDFVCASDNLDISNLATGSKTFAILSMLISNGNLNEKTLLILDEPEAHLHPSWQNKLAEILVLLIKELGIKIIVTSHSPNFVLALQTYTMKHQIANKSAFYSTKKRDDGYTVDFMKITDDSKKIYTDFAIPFSQIKTLYDSIYNGEQND